MPDPVAPSAGAEPPGPRASAQALAQAIRGRAREFDVAALVTLLRRRFPDLAIRFRSHHSSGLKPTLVHEVEFEDECVVVTLNLGLFSSTTSLPSYFQEWLDGSEPVPGLEAILGLLDDRLLRDRTDGANVVMSPRLLPRAAGLRRNLLQLARPGSACTLHWLFARLFPELGISVARSGVHRSLFAGEPRLGHARLGHTAIGGQADLLIPGYDVFLSTGESATWRGVPWAHEARRRLREDVFPALAETAVHLRIVLFDFEASQRLSLISSSTFGFDPLARAATPHVILLHEGKIDADVLHVDAPRGEVRQ